MKRLFCILFCTFCASLFLFSQDYKNWVRFAPRLPDAWFLTDSARLVGANVMAHQIENGAWPKNVNFFHLDSIFNYQHSNKPNAEKLAYSAEARRMSMDEIHELSIVNLNEATIDNGATTTEIRFLMRLFAATGDSLCLESALRGVRYLLSMQYDNGGFPQYFPRHDHYHARITFNDDAMVSVLRLLREVSLRRAPYGPFPLSLSVEAAAAVDRGVACILACQYVQHGVRTVWAQQYDEHTLQPAPARAFELAGLCSAESAAIVEFLQTVSADHPEVLPAIDDAIKWFRAHQLPDGRWARFYTLEDNRPFFCGRDGVMRFSLEEIDEERQKGYSWYNTRPAKLLRTSAPRP
jgi:pectinesterase